MSERIYERRTELGMTMQELGEKAGVTRSTVNKWEKGQIANIKRSTINKLATILECSPAWLMGIDEERTAALVDYSNVNIANLMGMLDRMNKVISENNLSDDDLKLLNAFHRADPNTQDLIKRVLEIKDKRID